MVPPPEGKPEDVDVVGARAGRGLAEFADVEGRCIGISAIGVPGGGDGVLDDDDLVVLAWLEWWAPGESLGSRPRAVRRACRVTVPLEMLDAVGHAELGRSVVRAGALVEQPLLRVDVGGAEGHRDAEVAIEVIVGSLLDLKPGAVAEHGVRLHVGKREVAPAGQDHGRDGRGVQHGVVDLHVDVGGIFEVDVDVVDE